MTTPPAILARIKAWQHAHPLKRLQYQHENRARRKGATVVERFSPDEIWERDGWRCRICGEIVDRKQVTLDHIVPIQRGGQHTRENVQTAHRACNARKWTRTPDESPPTLEEKRVRLRDATRRYRARLKSKAA